MKITKNLYQLQRLTIISLFLTITIIIFAIERFFFPLIGSGTAEIHYIPILSFVFFAKKYREMLTLFITASIMCMLISGYLLVTLLFDYLWPMFWCSVFYFFKNIKIKDKLLLTNFWFFIGSFLVFFIFLYAGHIVSGMLFFRVNFPAALILNVGYSAVTTLILMLTMKPIWHWSYDYYLKVLLPKSEMFQQNSK